MNVEEVKDKSVAMIVWNTQIEDDVHVYLGVVEKADEVYAFINKEEGWRVSLDDEQLSRIQPVTADLKQTLLDADYGFSMNMSALPDDDKGDYRMTGMKW